MEAKATADRAAVEARAATERSATEVARLKAENDRLTRDLDAVKELAELIKTPAGAVTGPASKPDPDRLAEQFFGDGLRAFHRGQYRKPSRRSARPCSFARTTPATTTCSG